MTCNKDVDKVIKKKTLVLYIFLSFIDLYNFIIVFHFCDECVWDSTVAGKSVAADGVGVYDSEVATV